MHLYARARTIYIWVRRVTAGSTYTPGFHAIATGLVLAETMLALRR